MIAFDLECSNGHRFEGWFNDNHSFNLQNDQGLVSCPHCNSCDITKLISTFNTKRFPSKKENKSELEAISHKIINYVKDNFDNVGTDFSNEALKMHYGLTKPRNIRGVSSPEEEKIMNYEGIKFIKLPSYDKKNDSN